MKERMISLLAAFLLIISLPLSAAAAEHGMVIDSAQLFTDQEQMELESTAQELLDTYQMDVVIVTVDSLHGKSAQQYADDYYDENDYGYGDEKSGILFLLAMEEREWYISTCGDAIYAVTDYGVQRLGEIAVWYLSEGEYYRAFESYLSALPDYLEAYQQGVPIDGYADYSGDYYHGERESVVYYEEEYSPSIFLSLVVSVVVAVVAILIMRSSMNTKRQQRGASSYLKTGSFHLKRHQDMFLYSNVSKVRRQQNNSGGGGSSVHRSSSGRSHGGGGGRF